MGRWSDQEVAIRRQMLQPEGGISRDRTGGNFRWSLTA